MLVVGVLLVSLVFLVLGVVLSSVIWLVGSLAVTVVAGALLLRPRTDPSPAPVDGQRPGTGATSDDSVGTPRGGLTDAGGDTAPAPPHEGRSENGADARVAKVLVIPGRPRYHRRGCNLIGADAPRAVAVPVRRAVEDELIPCSLCRPPTAAPVR